MKRLLARNGLALFAGLILAVAMVVGFPPSHESNAVGAYPTPTPQPTALAPVTVATGACGGATPIAIAVQPLHGAVDEQYRAFYICSDKTVQQQHVYVPNND